MNRFAVLATTLTLAGSVLLAPAALADPTLSVTSAGSTVGEGTEAQVGQLLDFEAAGCITTAGAPGYIGQFVDFPDRPEVPTDQFEVLTDSQGSFSLQFQIPEMPQPQHLDVHWYCSPAPVTSMDNLNDFLWLSPSVAITIKASDAPQNTLMSLRSTKTTASARTSAAPQPGATVTVDRDALPLVDRMGILGTKAATLKAKVDARIESDYQKQKATLVKQRKAPLAKDNSNAKFVKITFLLVNGKANPTASAMAPFIERLDQGALRVQVLEEIALSKSPAKVWNR